MEANTERHNGREESQRMKIVFAVWKKEKVRRFSANVSPEQSQLSACSRHKPPNLGHNEGDRKTHG